MNNTVRGRPELIQPLRDARTLADMGVPIIAGRLNEAGDPDTRDARWKAWQRSSASRLSIDRWARGEAMGALTGYAFDVIDVDPRSGGDLSFKQMAADLGEDGPEEYWRVRTSSGGLHIYVAPLGLGGHNGFMPGLDLKSKGGFVFIPPTIRPSKDPRNEGQRKRYRALSELRISPEADHSGGAARDYVTERLASKRGARGQVARGGRTAVGHLEAACLSAQRGEQHAALLALYDEWARKNDDDDYIAFKVWSVAQQMKNFDRTNPWTEAHIRGLKHREDRRPIADASEEEAADLMEIGEMAERQPSGGGGLRSLSSVSKSLMQWIWLRYLAVGDATLIDADAGAGKSVTSVDMIARFTTGRAMPCEAEALVPAGNVLLLAPEDRAEVILARVEAAGGDPERVMIVDVDIKRSKRGKESAYFGGHLITFPDNTEQFHRWIKQYKIGLVVVDPIAAFLSEKIDPHKDASVRKALEPFVMVLGKENCSAWLIRHLNKDTKQSAAHRGGGSVAFGAVARTHLFAGPMPESYVGEATHGIAIIKSNNLKRTAQSTLAYQIVDSDIPADDQGNFVPRVAWHGKVAITAQQLASGDAKHPGPDGYAQQAIREAVEPLFADRDEVPFSEIRPLIDKITQDGKTIQKAREAMRCISVKRGGKAGGVQVWAMRTKTRIGNADE